MYYCNSGTRFPSFLVVFYEFLLLNAGNIIHVRDSLKEMPEILHTS